MVHLGFYNTATTRYHVRFGLPTLDRSGGNVAPSSALEAADLRIYRAADSAAISDAQRSSANGITMTSPFDSITGGHTVDIDLSDNTDAGFYASGYYYEVWLCPDETIDSQTLTGVPLVCFEIGLQPVNVTQLLGTAWLTPGTAGTPDVNVKLVSGDSTAADNLEAILDGTSDSIDLLEFIRGANAMLLGAGSGLDGGIRTFRDKANTKDVAVWAITSSTRAAVLDLT